MNPNDQSTQQPQQQGDGASWWQNLLPTAGGILGGLGGAALGGAVDVGTLGLAAPFVNPITAGIAGAGLGGAGGQAVKNATMGQNPLQANDISSGLENALGQATGEVGGMLAKPLFGALGNAADRAGFNLFKGQFNPTSIAKSGLTDADLKEVMDSGITNANDVGQHAQIITTKDGALPRGVNRAFQEAPPTDITGLNGNVNNMMAGVAQRKPLSDKDITDLSTEFNENLKSVVPKESISTAPTRRASGGFSNAPKQVSIISPEGLRNADPNAIGNLASMYHTMADATFNSARNEVGKVVNAGADAKATVYSGIADELDKIANTGISDSNRAEIIADLGPLKDVNPTAYTRLVDQVNHAQSTAELKSIQAPWVRANQALTGTAAKTMAQGGVTPQKLLGGGVGVLGAITGNPLEMAAGGLSLLASHPAAGKIGTNVLGRVSDILTNPVIKSSLNAAKTPADKMIASAMPLAGGVLGTTAANVPSYSFDNNPQGGGMQPTAATTPATGSPVASPEALQMMLGLVGLQADPYMASTFAPMVTGAVPQLQQASSAQAVLPGLERLFTQAGGGQGGMNGLLARLQSLVPGSTGQQYNAQAAQLQQTLQKLGLPGTVTPSLFAGPEAQNAGFGNIQAAINAMGGNPQSLLAGVPAS